MIIERLAKLLRADDGRLRLLPCPGGWAEAERLAKTYRKPDPRPHMERVREATRAVRDGRAPGTRDSVILDSPEFQFPVLAALLKYAALHRPLRLVDFGGSLGSSCFQFRRFAPEVPVAWSIVELPEMAACGRAEFETGELRFHDSLEDCLANEQPHVALLSGVLHLLELPHEVLDHFAHSSCQAIVLDRVPLIDDASDLAAAHVVTGSRFASDRSFPCWLFGEQRLLDHLARDWTVAAKFASLDSPEMAGDLRVTFTGFLLERH